MKEELMSRWTDGLMKKGLLKEGLCEGRAQEIKDRVKEGLLSGKIE